MAIKVPSDGKESQRVTVTASNEDGDTLGAIDVDVSVHANGSLVIEHTDGTREDLGNAYGSTEVYRDGFEGIDWSKRH